MSHIQSGDKLLRAIDPFPLVTHWFEGIEVLCLAETMGKMAACCVAPFSKPHYVEESGALFCGLQT